MTGTEENAARQAPNRADWDQIAASEQFQDLVAIKKMFIVPALVFFLLYFAGLPVLVGYAPKLASTRVLGTVNVAYLFALSQFVVGWIIAAAYLVASKRFDALTKDILAKVDQPQGGK
jgi:uncharacterized membrane protein (DUF485 family)